MLEKICERLVTALKLKSKVIYRRNDEPYLTRYYIYRKTKRWQPSIYIHCFHASDEDLELHNHPWKRSLSFILSGSYREEYLDNGVIESRILSPGRFNYILANKFHRVDLLTKNVWTIFISGSKGQDWGFWNRNTLEFVDHETFEKRKKALGFTVVSMMDENDAVYDNYV